MAGNWGQAMLRRSSGSAFHANRWILLSAAMILSLLSFSFKPAPRNYLDSLVMLDGTEYWSLNCSQYICAAKRHRECLAEKFWLDGCDGDAAVVQHVPSFDNVDASKLLPGDVAVFHGVHVAAFIGNGTWMDSDFKHAGVGIMRPSRRRGGWFYGEVKILRWRK
jgi:hypothetical protein